MEDTLIKGDIILVSKLNYGPALPRSPLEIPWISTAFYLNKKTRYLSDSIWWNYKRLPGYSKIKRGDVFVFKFNRNDYSLIKRCVGLPGDTLQINDGAIVNNSKLLKTTLLTKNIYIVNISNLKLFDFLCDSMGVLYKLNNDSTTEITLNKLEENYLFTAHTIDSIVIKPAITDTLRIESPTYISARWSIACFDKYVVPYKGMTITLGRKAYDMYKNTIIRYENADFKQVDNCYYLNGKEVNNYTFRNDYFFMMGDFRSNSIDSRFKGPIPEESIIGKSVVVLCSNGNDGFRWKRLFKKIE